jgi:DNA polymerase-3 subunit gamma/tau
MSQVLYRQYRPQKFEQVLGQEAARTTLQNAVKAGKVAHAYLFTGPRGVGKTSLARILAKAVNCLKPEAGEPCDECANCQAIREGHFLDLIEIDAASHTGVDNIREIIEHVKFSPSSGKFKVIVIDEVHMLSKGAFNALLKTLEEPPQHAVFVLATTEIGKVPATIISRTQRFEFKKLTTADIISQLKLVAADQKLTVSDEVLRLVAQAAEGGMRDALSLFDQLLSFTGGRVTLEQAEEVLGLTPFSLNQDFFGLLAGKDAAGAIGFLKQLANNGRDILQFAHSFLVYLDLVLGFSLRNSRLEETGLLAEDFEILKKHASELAQSELARLLELFLTATQKVRYSPIPELPLELAVVEFIQSAGQSPKPNASDGGVKSGSQSEKPVEQKTVPPAATKKFASLAKADMMGEVSKNWNNFLARLRDYNHSLISSLKLATLVRCDGEVLCVAFPYRFHKDAVEQIKNKIVVEKVLSEIYGRPLRLECKMLHEVDEPTAAPEKKESSGLLEEAMKVFGSAN